MKMVHFPAYIRLPGIYNYHFEKNPTSPTLGVPAKRCIKGKDTSNRLDTSNSRETWQANLGHSELCRKKKQHVSPYLCHLQKKNTPMLPFFQETVFVKGISGPFTICSPPRLCMKGPLWTPKNIYTIRFQVRSKLDPTKKTGGQLLIFPCWVFF